MKKAELAKKVAELEEDNDELLNRVERQSRTINAVTERNGVLEHQVSALITILHRSTS